MQIQIYYKDENEIFLPTEYKYIIYLFLATCPNKDIEYNYSLIFKYKQAGTELGQAQLTTGIWFYYEMTRHLVLLFLLSRPTFQFSPF